LRALHTRSASRIAAILPPLLVLGVMVLSASASPLSTPGAMAHGPTSNRTSTGSQGPRDSGLPSSRMISWVLPSLGLPSAGPVNPQRSYSAEPAPMGIADFGVNGLDQPYSYSTSTFVGTANITTLKSNVVGNPSAGNIAFELNTVLTFGVGSTNYSYWLQDGFDVDSHFEHITLLQDYVWNFTSTSASMNAGSISGNGSLVNAGGYDIYISYPPDSLPGNNITLSLPMTLQLRIVTGTVGGNAVPWVGYDYNDGFGWIRGSSDSFPFAHDAVRVGQSVDGYAYTPNGAYYDAEFDYAGPGGGVGTDTGSNLQMTLDRWNGHNLQPVPNAYNHGGNTGEKIENLTVVSTTALGSPGATIGHGPGTLGLLYSSNQTGTLTVTAPWFSGTIGVDGTPVAFTGSEANLTLDPGVYELTLYEGSSIVGRTSASVTAGSEGTIALTPNLLEPVTITASGIPSGTAWSILWNGTRYNGTAPSILLDALNGTYPLSTNAIRGFVSKAPTVEVTVHGATFKTLAWTTFNYTVTFQAIGLTDGAAWSVEANGVLNRSTGADLTLQLPNGTAAYSVGCPFAYLPDPASGNITVEAESAMQTINFGLKPSYLVGTLSPGDAVLEVGGAVAPVVGGNFNVTVLPGVHDVTATLTGYTPFRENLTTTPGNVTMVKISLLAIAPQPPNPPATFLGLPAMEGYEVLGGVIGVLVIAGLVLVLWGRKRKIAPDPS
jgi:hypothetical protein